MSINGQRSQEGIGVKAPGSGYRRDGISPEVKALTRLPTLVPRVMMACNDRHVTRASRAAFSPASPPPATPPSPRDARVNRDPCRAQGTAATTTPVPRAGHPWRACLQEALHHAHVHGSSHRLIGYRR